MRTLSRILIAALPAAIAHAQAPVADTTFSFDRGLYQAPFVLTIASATPGATIRYTLDCSDPRTSANIAQGVTPVTVTIWKLFQFAVEKVSGVGPTETAVGSLGLTLTTTVAAGIAVKRTPNITMPFSVSVTVGVLVSMSS